MARENKAKVNLSEVAKAAGVSKMTASRVLRNASGFSEETRQRVLREVERLGYVPNRIAAAFGSEQTSTIIGVSVPFLSSSLFGAVLDSTNGALAKFGYQTMIGAHENSSETEETWVKNILSWRPAGLILSAPRHSKATRDLLRNHGIPVAEIWNLNTSPIDLSVGFNHYDCGHEMALYILSKGYRRIGYVGADALAPGLGALRRKGFIAALEASNMTFASEEILSDRSSFYAGFYGTETILNRNRNLDCIYFQDDAMAIGGYFYCKSKDLRVPQDIAIAGWGSMEIASVLPQRLTTTVVSTQALGKAAAQSLVARIRGEPVDDVVISGTRLAPGATV
ncbi:LacI family DNA-binding transcriptional regulator [Hoeflea prorocentri]|uniref:LacI family DNA-binding transcriptional regulator n=1 Tax=Hoeflea prorocentri TaxID=1922333 RepID=A0A9X3UIB5_9HYPH|nr:LacI family DNA-binding transcriptional regulator [Hoeflea prorocentri]MCY6379729.1 LacI family DNA-binding transcriptional regulator [Hoeflea prorocentri]MDA5397529.1 LacI family DNA-binding transcriptional regulator [Hoeflea prorocentri]